MNFIEHNDNGVVWMTAPNLTARHAFTTRFGGVSGDIWASLNLGEHRGDDPENVRENYRRVKQATGIDTDRLVFTRQVHGREVRIATEADIHTLFTPVPYEADGLVTNIPGLPITCFIADCVPLLMEDTRHGVIAAVHCGWRSTVQDIMAAAVEKMLLLGAQPGEIRAAIGESIGACCFDTGPEVPEAVYALLPDWYEGLVRPGKTPDKSYVDLREAIRRRLVQLGVPAEQIAVSDECTMCRPDKYWSHRATKGQRGHQAAMIVLDD